MLVSSFVAGGLAVAGACSVRPDGPAAGEGAAIELEDGAGSDESHDSAASSESESHGSVDVSTEAEATDQGDASADADTGTTPKFDLGVIPDQPPDDDRVCDIDFLFVIDNSISMLNEQDSLAASVPQFIETVQGTLDVDDFHLGVVTTDAYRWNDPACNVMGGLVVATGGNGSSNASCGPYANGRNFMTAADDLSRSFPCAAQPGTQGAKEERPMQAMIEAVSPGLAAAGACNEGFIRDGSMLVVVVITDEEDGVTAMGPGSPGDPESWYRSMVEAKGRLENLVVLTLIGLPKPNECASGGPLDGAQEAKRILEFARKFGDNGFAGDVCADAYGPFFEEAVSVIERACDQLPEG